MGDKVLHKDPEYKKEPTPQKKQAVSHHNFLVIAVFLLLSLYVTTALPQAAFPQELPQPVGYVNDFAGVIDQSSKQRITALAGALKEKTGAEIAVVTVDTIAPYAAIEQYSVELATKWGIGKKGEDTGILILLAMKEKRVRLEVGYGLEGIIPDGLAGQILDQSILPSLKKGNYGDSLLKGVEAAAGIIAKEYGVDLSSYNITESQQYTQTGGFPTSILIFLILMFLFGGGRFLLFPLLFLGGVSRGGFFGGGFGSGSSSMGGGFSGFGGGGFGGGGASRGF